MAHARRSRTNITISHDPSVIVNRVRVVVFGSEVVEGRKHFHTAIEIKVAALSRRSLGQERSDDFASVIDTLSGGKKSLGNSNEYRPFA